MTMTLYPQLSNVKDFGIYSFVGMVLKGTVGPDVPRVTTPVTDEVARRWGHSSSTGLPRPRERRVSRRRDVGGDRSVVERGEEVQNLVKLVQRGGDCLV